MSYGYEQRSDSGLQNSELQGSDVGGVTRSDSETAGAEARADQSKAKGMSRLAARHQVAQLKATAGSPASASTLSDASSAGEQLPDRLQTKMEGAFGADFSDVRVHSDGAAEQVGAQAYAAGNDVHFAAGRYDPESQEGQELIGHELTHVVQQRGGGAINNAAPQGKDGDAPFVNSDVGLEAEADRMGARAAKGASADVRGVASHGAGAQLRGAARRTPPSRSRLDRARDVNAPIIADELVARIDDQLASKAVLRFNSADDGKMKERLRVAAKARAELTAENDATATDKQKADVKSRSVDIAAGSADNAIAKKAASVARQLAATTKGAFSAKARSGFDAVKVSNKGVTESVIASAKKRARRAASKIYTAQYKAQKVELDKQLEDNSAFEADLTAGSKDTATTRAGAAMRRRKAGDITLEAVTTSAVKPQLDALEKSTTAYLADKLGANGAHFWRSDELIAFRKKMKEAARAQASADVDANIGLAVGGTATKKYTAMDAKMRAYDTAKKSANAELLTLAEEGTGSVLTQVGAEATIASAARQAAFAEKESRSGSKAIARSANAAAAKSAKHVKIATMAAAKLWKDDIVKNADPAQLLAKQDEVARDVAHRVETDEVGKKAVQTSIKANSADEGLGKLGKLLDFLVPSRGDSVSLSVELEIPIPNSPAFILVAFSGEAARGVTDSMSSGASSSTDTKSLEVSSEVQIGAGIDVWGLKADAAIGAFIRAGAGSTDKTMKALSYGIYRKCCDVSDGLANFWAGSSKKGDAMTGMSDVERAELWAAMVEEQAFADDDDAYVELGASLRARGKLNAAKLQAEGEVRGEMLRNYSKETLGGSAKVGNTDFTEKATAQQRKAAAKARRADMKGERKYALNIDAGVQFEILGTGVDFAAALSFESAQDWEVEIGAGLTLDTTGDSSATQRIAAGIVGGSLSAAKTVAGLFQTQDKSKRELTADRASSGFGLVEDITRVVDAGLGNRLGTALSNAYQADASKSDEVNETVTNLLGTQSNDMSNQAQKGGIGAEYSLKVAISFGRSGGSPVFSVNILEANKRKLDVGIGTLGLGVEYETTKRIGGFGVTDGKLWGEGLGFRTGS